MPTGNVPSPSPTLEREFYDPAISRVQSAMGDAQFVAAQTKGSSMALEKVVEYALSGTVESIGSR